MAAAERVEPEMLSDELLVERVIQGEEEAFALLYERYFNRVYRFTAKRLRNRADVEESVQETFISVFSALPSFRAEAPFAAWVLGVARHTIAGRFKKKRHPTVPLEHEGEPDTMDLLAPTLQRAATPLENYECRERISRIEDAAERDLTAEQWTLFELHHLRHHSISQIAVDLDKSEDSVKSNLYRARKLLLAR